MNLSDYASINVFGNVRPGDVLVFNGEDGIETITVGEVVRTKATVIVKGKNLDNEHFRTYAWKHRNFTKITSMFSGNLSVLRKTA